MVVARLSPFVRCRPSSSLLPLLLLLLLWWRCCCCCCCCGCLPSLFSSSSFSDSHHIRLGAATKPISTAAIALATNETDRQRNTSPVIVARNLSLLSLSVSLCSFAFFFSHVFTHLSKLFPALECVCLCCERGGRRGTELGDLPTTLSQGSWMWSGFVCNGSVCVCVCVWLSLSVCPCNCIVLFCCVVCVDLMGTYFSFCEFSSTTIDSAVLLLVSQWDC